MSETTSPTIPASLADLTREELLLRVAELEARGVQNIRYKVSEKGAVSIYGLNAQFPTTLYLSQIERLMGSIDSESDYGRVPEIKAFCREHRGELTVKGEKKPDTQASNSNKSRNRK